MSPLIMHARLTPIDQKSLADPAACGVRLGVELRAAAEREAYDQRMWLSHWIKRLVPDAVSNADTQSTANSGTRVKSSLGNPT